MMNNSNNNGNSGKDGKKDPPSNNKQQKGHPSSSSTRLEQDVTAKQQGRPSVAASTPGAVAVSGNKNSSDAASNKVRGSAPATKPGAQAVVSASRQDAVAAAKSSKVSSGGNAGQQPVTAPAQLTSLEKSVTSKVRGTHKPATTPGAQAVKGGQGSQASSKVKRATPVATPSMLANLEVSIAEKTRGGPPAVIPGFQSVTREDRSVSSKLRAEQNVATPDELSTLEEAVAGKVRGKPATEPGAQTIARGDQQQQKMTKTNVITAATTVEQPAQLTNMEQSITNEKQRIAPTAAMTPDAEISVDRQGNSSVPTKTRGTNVSTSGTLVSLEESIAQKGRGVEPTNTPEPNAAPASSSKDSTSANKPSSQVIQESAPLKNKKDDKEQDDEGLAVAIPVEEEDDEMFRPQAVEYDPDAKPPIYRTRRFRLFACLAFVCAAIAIGVGVGLTVGKNDVPPPTAAPTSFRETLNFQGKIEEVFGSEVLEDPDSPYSKALEWIIDDDPMQLHPDSPNFIQRYIAAYFYFATTANGPWLSCNPPDDPWSGFTFCYLMDYWDENIPFEYHEVSANRWLSNITECVWAGVRCNEEGQIHEIDVKGNELSGQFPLGISHLPMLENITLSWGTMSGPLPAKLGEMKQLRRIELSQHAFTGSIPDEWWQLTNLHKLLIGGNKLTGTISPEVANLKEMDELAFHANRLSGTIPEEMGSLAKMKYLDLSQNRLEGPLRISSDWGNMRWLWLHRNQITGTIPSSIAVMSELNWLRIQETKMTGELPEELYSLSVLAHFQIQNCDFSGTISTSIENYGKYMREYHISGNRFHGTIPTEMGKLTSLETVWLHDNDFTGAVPADVCDIGLILEEMEADCTPSRDGAVELSCSCCTKCCRADGTDCLAT